MVVVFIFHSFENFLQYAIADVIDKEDLMLCLLGNPFEWFSDVLLYDKDSLLEAVEHALVLFELMHSLLLRHYLLLYVLVNEGEEEGVEM